MSKEQQDVNVTPEQEAALGIMYKEAFVPSFFGRLAQHGVRVDNEADANELLKIADMLADAGAVDPSIYDAAVEANADSLLKSASGALAATLQGMQPSSSLVEAAAALA